MSTRKVLQAPALPRGPRNIRRPQAQSARGFWEWLWGGYYRNG